MKYYKPRKSSIFIYLLLGFLCICLYIFLPSTGYEYKLIDHILLISLILFFQIIVVFIATITIKISDSGFIYKDFFREKSFLWKDLAKVEFKYHMDPSLDAHVHFFLKDSDPKPIYLSTSIYKLDLIKDILRHIQKDVNVGMYEYLRRKLDGKQTWFFRKQ